mmetsp:Transcript_8049/g.19051  ORF Transcript_8049/g.19051 Transcript_8049/m.19051 type:complete len:374 (-) Transcript_8049:232-1353(-)
MRSSAKKEPAPGAQTEPHSVPSRSTSQASPSQPTKKVLLVGETGQGKSLIGNLLLGRQAFVSAESSSSVTQKCSRASSFDEEFETEFQVVDTIGLMDTHRAPQEVYEILTEFTKLVPDGVHAVVVVLPGGRSKEAEARILDVIGILFGVDVWSYCIVVFNMTSAGVTPSQIWADRTVTARAQFLDRWNEKGAKICTVREVDVDWHAALTAAAADVRALKQTILGRQDVYTPAMFRKAGKDFQEEMARVMGSMGPGVIGWFLELARLSRSSSPADMENLNKQLLHGEITRKQHEANRERIEQEHAAVCYKRNQLTLFTVSAGVGGAWLAGRLLAAGLWGALATGAASAGGTAVVTERYHRANDTDRPSSKNRSS